MGWVLRALSTFVFVAVCFSAPLSAAQRRRAAPEESAASTQARALFAEGQSAYLAGHYEEAVTRFNEAYALSPRPLLQYNLSSAYERLGQYRNAIAALERYLNSAARDDENQTNAVTRMNAMRERLARTSVRLVGGRPGGTVRVDGVSQGTTPLSESVRVEPGNHELVVEYPNHAPFRAAFVVPETQIVEVQIGMTDAVATNAQPTSSSAHSSTPGQDFPVAPVVVLGVGVAALVTGGILGGLGMSQAGSAPSSSGPEADGARGLALGADIAFGVGVAAAAVGVVWLIVELSDNHGERHEAPAVSLFAAPDRAGATLRTNF